MGKALLLIDVQPDFFPGGSLAVPGADALFPLINQLMPKFDLVVATQDWHPADHLSFASNHNKAVGSVVDLDGVEQILWPDHCVQKTEGAQLHPQLDQSQLNRIVKKGTQKGIDSYSAFFDNQKLYKTELDVYLRANNINQLYLAGLALDYCVQYSALDAADLGYKCFVIMDATFGVELAPGDIDKAKAKMHQHGVQLINSQQI